MKGVFEYFRIAEGEPFPDISFYRPFKAIVVASVATTVDFEILASRWLVDSGCLYMMAWGENCSRWDDMVDWANLEDFDYGEIPDEHFVMTTWHEHEPLKEVMWFAHNCATAYMDSLILRDTLIIHVSADTKRDELLALYASASDPHYIPD